VNRARSLDGNFPLAPAVILVVMSRERVAVVALAVLFALAAAPALLLRGGTAVAGPSHHTPNASAVTVEVTDSTSIEYVCAGVPIFPGATLMGRSVVDPAVVGAINALHVTPELEAGPTLRAPFQAWTAGMQHGKDLLSFYARRMRTVNFWDMTRRLRTLIGVRPGGTVDSPPLLYASPNGAVLLRPHPHGTLDLVLLCPPASG
jgi:hypothetical protein